MQPCNSMERGNVRHATRDRTHFRKRASSWGVDAYVLVFERVELGSDAQGGTRRKHAVHLICNRSVFGADMAGASPVPVQMWKGLAQPRLSHSKKPLNVDHSATCAAHAPSWHW